MASYRTAAHTATLINGTVNSQHYHPTRLPILIGGILTYTVNHPQAALHSSSWKVQVVPYLRLQARRLVHWEPKTAPYESLQRHQCARNVLGLPLLDSLPSLWLVVLYLARCEVGTATIILARRTIVDSALLSLGFICPKYLSCVTIILRLISLRKHPPQLKNNYT